MQPSLSSSPGKSKLFLVSFGDSAVRRMLGLLCHIDSDANFPSHHVSSLRPHWHGVVARLAIAWLRIHSRRFPTDFWIYSDACQPHIMSIEWKPRKDKELQAEFDCQLKGMFVYVLVYHCAIEDNTSQFEASSGSQNCEPRSRKQPDFVTFPDNLMHSFRSNKCNLLIVQC